MNCSINIKDCLEGELCTMEEMQFSPARWNITRQRGSSSHPKLWGYLAQSLCCISIASGNLRISVDFCGIIDVYTHIYTYTYTYTYLRIYLLIYCFVCTSYVKHCIPVLNHPHSLSPFSPSDWALRSHSLRKRDWSIFKWPMKEYTVLIHAETCENVVNPHRILEEMQANMPGTPLQ